MGPNLNHDQAALTRAVAALERAGKILVDVPYMSDYDLLKIEGIGRKGVVALRERFAEAFGPLVVTRHPALVELLRERGIVGDSADVRAHVGEDDVRGRHVIGVLPLRLAALAWRVTEIPLELAPEDRGRELDLERLRQIAGEAKTYTVRAI